MSSTHMFSLTVQILNIFSLSVHLFAVTCHAVFSFYHLTRIGQWKMTLAAFLLRVLNWRHSGCSF